MRNLVISAAAALAAAALVVVMPAAADARTSINWSGHAASGSFTSVSATWIQPAASCTSTHTSASFWVGLDGLISETVEQIGTRASCVGGLPQYESWVQVYPDTGGAVRLPVAVRPLDRISASVVVGRGGTVTMTLTNQTTARSATTRVRVKAAAFSSAEVIAEEPYLLSNGQLTQVPLTNFGTVKFVGAKANGRPLGEFNPEEIDLAQNGLLKADALPLTQGTDFSVNWLAP